VLFITKNTYMAFQRIKGGSEGLIERNITTTAFTVGQLLMYDRATGNTVIAATSSAEIDTIAGVVVQASTATDTKVLLQKICQGDEYIVDTTHDTSLTHNYMRNVLTDSNTVDNDGSDTVGDTGVFLQTGMWGASDGSDRLIIGEFVTGTHGD
jgi:hypothetical protein